MGNNNEINLGNICFNNTLKRPIKNEKKKEIINNETNLIHQYGIKKDGNNNNENKFKQNQNGRVRPLKIWKNIFFFIFINFFFFYYIYIN